jgi:hypothetical protein
MADEDEGPAIRLVPSRDPNTPRASDGLSGNPFGKPTDNPFATAPSSDEGGSNPFANQPGPGTSNPFGTAPRVEPVQPSLGGGSGAELQSLRHPGVRPRRKPVWDRAHVEPLRGARRQRVPRSRPPGARQRGRQLQG